MGLALAFVEGLFLLTAVLSTVLLWVRPVVTDWLDAAALLGQAVALTGCCIVSFYYNDLYDLRIVPTFREFAGRLLQAFGIAFILLGGFYLVFPTTNIAEGAFLSSFLLLLGFLIPLRAFSYIVLRTRLFTERMLILGSSPLALSIIAEIEAQPLRRYVVVGVVEDLTRAALPGYRQVGPLDRLDKVIEDVNPDRIVVALTERRGRLPVQQVLAARLAGIAVSDGVDLFEHLTGKVAIESLSPSSLIFSHDFRKSRLDLVVGRAVSLATAAIGLVLCAPLALAIGVAIRLDSPGPILFAHERIGLRGRRFTLLKFRTMHSKAGETSEWVRDNSDRITRVGRWLRKYRLDELPQFVNMIRGDMNLVGPRPHPVTNEELFTVHIPYYSLRSVVRPGVTGWAQIRYGYANNLEEEIEKMRYDLYYIKHLSLWFDLRILFDTVKTVLFARGSGAADAYPVNAGEASR
jgi:exopolysaccharide biosynthesis polyprenyl glycosylphosphotransferase